MYRHLLVPIDGTDLAIELVGNAVALARALGARITFFHAALATAGSPLGEPDAQRLPSPEDFRHVYVGRPRELLAKAEAAARALGVPCDSAHVASDRPAQAIVAAAREKACDLVVITSQGRLGTAFSSETLRVLMASGLPVLVSAAGEFELPARAVGIIRDEHRSLAAVLHVWMHELAKARQGDGDIDSVLMRAIVRYLQEFPVILHHPKEERLLFRLLRQRTSVVDAELAELERQHERDRVLVAELAQRVKVLAETGDSEARAARLHELEEGVACYAAFMWDHLGREEGVILPAAQRYLGPSDWAEIEAGFSANLEPGFVGDADADYRRLFLSIVSLAAES